MIPEDAVVVAGFARGHAGQGADWGISIYTPVIVKYRDDEDRYEDSARRPAALSGASSSTSIVSAAARSQVNRRARGGPSAAKALPQSYV